MQAIQVKFIGPTDTKGSRYKATCQGGSRTVQARYDLSPAENAQYAAEVLRDYMGWTGDQYGELVAGGLPNGDYVFCFSDRALVAREALASLKRITPWLARLIADGGHSHCANPNDAVAALNQACSLINKHGEG